MKFVTNSGEDHGEAIFSVLSGATSAKVAVAFLKKKGAHTLTNALKVTLQGGGDAFIVVGSDFCLTDPAALEVLLDLKRKFPKVDLRLANSSRQTFHPKVYFGYRGGKFRCLVGSANLTSGALSSNVEASIRQEDHVGSPLGGDFDRFFSHLNSDTRYQKLDEKVLNRYRRVWSATRAARRNLEKQIEEANKPAVLQSDFDNMFALYSMARDISSDRERRRKVRLQALKAQNGIVRLGSARHSKGRQQKLADQLNRLMSGSKGERLWASKGIHRTGVQALKVPDDTIELFSICARASKRETKVGYEMARERAREINGVGINMLTEILCTFAPDKFPVINGSVIKAMNCLGVECKKISSLDRFNSSDYLKIVRDISGIRKKIGARDFLESDAFLRWVAAYE